MNKITVKIDGMTCGMCEAHVCDTLRKAFPDAKKVKASRKNGEATFLTENTPETEMLAKAITDTGYTFVSAASEPYRRHGLFG